MLMCSQPQHMLSMAPAPTDADVALAPTRADVVPAPTRADVVPAPTHADVVPAPTCADMSVHADADMSGPTDAVASVPTAVLANITDITHHLLARGCQPSAAGQTIYEQAVATTQVVLMRCSKHHFLYGEMAEASKIIDLFVNLITRQLTVKGFLMGMISFLVPDKNLKKTTAGLEMALTAKDNSAGRYDVSIPERFVRVVCQAEAIKNKTGDTAKDAEELGADGLLREILPKDLRDVCSLWQGQVDHSSLRTGCMSDAAAQLQQTGLK
eukprot:jgi/Chrzof1/13757/Cz08g11030.t1